MILYISSSKIKKETTIGSAVDDNLIQPCIYQAQERYIMPILGTNLTDKLDAIITAGEVNLPANAIYKTILEEYIGPTEVQYAYCELCIYLRIRFSNNSITIPSSEQGQPATPEDIKFLLDRSKNLGNFYAERLINFLFANTSSIPEMQNNQYPKISPTRINYNGGLNIYYTSPLPNQILAWLQGIGSRYLSYYQ